MGPGGPLGIIGRPYGLYPGYGGYPSGGLGYGGLGNNFEGQYNGIGQLIGGSPYGGHGGHGGFPGGQGVFPGVYSGGPGVFPGAFGGFPGRPGFPGQLFDSTGSKNSQANKIEKSAK